jgi:IS5 family transposase
MTRAASSQVSFADLEFLEQGVRLEPMLKAISDFLDDHGHLIDKVRRDLNRGLKNPKTGRSGLTAQQVLRSFVLQRVKLELPRTERTNRRRIYIAEGSLVSTAASFPNMMLSTGLTRLTPVTLEVINELPVRRPSLSASKTARNCVDTTA